MNAMNTLNEIKLRYNGTGNTRKINATTIVQHHPGGSVSVYVEASNDYYEWATLAEQARREHGIRIDGVIGAWTADPNKAPITSGTYLLEYDPANRLFIPFLSITIANKHDFNKVSVEAFSLAGQYYIALKKTGDVPNDERIYYPAGNRAMSDLTARFNARM